MSPGLAPRMSGRLRGGHTSISTVASGAANALTSRPIASRWSSFRPWKVPVSSTRPKPEPTTRSCARCRALSTLSTPVTCQPRLAGSTPPDPAAGAEVERRPVGRLAPALLTVQKL
jgi:hypothetical protein